MYKLKQINFNEEMEKDLNEIKISFKRRFGVEPSNTSIMNLLLQTYKETNLDIRKTPRKRKEFVINI